MELSRVVIGIDFRAPSLAAVSWLHRHFAPAATVHGVHVIEAPSEPRTALPAAWVRERLTQVTRSAEEQLAALQSRLGPTMTTQVYVGRPWEALSRCADETRANLIVVGPHDGSDRAWRPLGTTVERLIRTTQRSVLLAAHLPESPPRRILVGLDEADTTDAVLDAVVTLAARLDAEVHAVHVFSVARMSHILSVAAVGAPSADESAARVRAALHREEVRWHARFETHGAPRRLHIEITDGKVSDVLLARAAAIDADLMILGREGSGRIGPLLLGSTVHAVMQGARCPVLVVTGSVPS